MINFLWFISIACILGGLLVIMIQLWEKIDYAKRQNRPLYTDDYDNPDPYPLNPHEQRWRQAQVERAQQARRDEGWFPQ